MNTRQLAVANNPGIGVCSPQPLQQGQQRVFLLRRPCVGSGAVGIETSLVAHAQGVAVVAHGVGTGQLFMARLVGPAVAGDVIVVARVSEPLVVVAYKGRHWVWSVTARGAAVDNNHINLTHSITLFHAALREERADDGGEYGDNELDDGLPGLQVFQHFHNVKSKFSCLCW